MRKQPIQTTVVSRGVMVYRILKNYFCALATRCRGKRNYHCDVDGVDIVEEKREFSDARPFLIFLGDSLFGTTKRLRGTPEIE